MQEQETKVTHSESSSIGLEYRGRGWHMSLEREAETRGRGTLYKFLRTVQFIL